MRSVEIQAKGQQLLPAPPTPSPPLLLLPSLGRVRRREQELWGECHPLAPPHSPTSAPPFHSQSKEGEEGKWGVQAD